MDSYSVFVTGSTLLSIQRTIAQRRCRQPQCSAPDGEKAVVSAMGGSRLRISALLRWLLVRLLRVKATVLVNCEKSANSCNAVCFHAAAIAGFSADVSRTSGFDALVGDAV